jgi:hypothetical protein
MTRESRAQRGDSAKQVDRLVAELKRLHRRISAIESTLNDVLRVQLKIVELLQRLAAGLHQLELLASEDEGPATARRIDDVRAAQERTNRLLELALRAAFDDEEGIRRS